MTYDGDGDDDGARGYTEKADVYSLALVWWELFAGQRPYAGLVDMQLLRRVGMKGERPQVRTTTHRESAQPHAHN